MTVEFVFERTGESSLAHAYRILVPERRGRARQSDQSHDGAVLVDPFVSGAGTTEAGGDRLATDGAGRDRQSLVERLEAGA